jgi:hypothetical protein
MGRSRSPCRTYVYVDVTVVRCEAPFVFPWTSARMKQKRPVKFVRGWSMKFSAVLKGTLDVLRLLASKICIFVPFPGLYFAFNSPRSILLVLGSRKRSSCTIFMVNYCTLRFHAVAYCLNGFLWDNASIQPTWVDWQLRCYCSRRRQIDAVAVWWEHVDVYTKCWDLWFKRIGYA